MEKYCRAGQAIDDNMAHVYCTLYTSDYKHALKLCNTYCFYIATMTARTCLNVTLYVHCLSCQYNTQMTLEHCRSQHCMSLLGLICWSHVQYLEASEISYNANIIEPQSGITYRIYYKHGCLKLHTS